MTGYHIALVVIGALLGAGITLMEVAHRRDERRLAAENEPPQPSREEHVDAVWALCCASPQYVDARMAAYEAEVTHLAELVLELDDQAPKPAGPED